MKRCMEGQRDLIKHLDREARYKKDICDKRVFLLFERYQWLLILIKREHHIQTEDVYVY